MRCLAAAAHFLIRKKLFNTKYPQLLVAKDFTVAEKKLHLTVSGRKYDPGKKAPKKRCTSDVKQQIPNHQLHKTSPPLDSSHKTNPSLNSSHKMNLSLNSSHKMSPSLNSSHKMSLSLNSSHKACPLLNNNHKTKHLILSHLNLTMMMHHFQIMPKL